MHKINETPQLHSTADNSLAWKLWHGLNFLSGGITFVWGSIIMFPGLD
jgi:hypothetical protein